MRADIEPDAGPGQRLFPPGVGFWVRTVSVEMRFEKHDVAQRAFRHHLLHRREIPGVAAILIDRDEAPLLPGDLDQVFRLGERRGERLVDHDVPAREQRLLGDRMVGRIGRGDDDEIDLGLEHVIDAAYEFDVRETRIVWTLALDNGRQSQPLDGTNDRRVEDLAREAETDKADVEGRQSLVMMKSGAPST